MLKIEFKYGPLFSLDNNAIEVVVYDTEPKKNGTHICATSYFNAHMLKGLSKKKIESLLANLQGSIEACNEDVEHRKIKEGESI